MNRDRALQELLRSLFSAEELCRYLAMEPDGEDLVDALPLQSSRALLISAAVEVLKRRGMCDRAFFDRLEVERKRRVDEIRKVRSLWLRGSELDRDALWAEGHYKLVAPCGSGGFGLVWKAIDTQTGAYVALKILHEQHADNRTMRQRFYRGAAVLAKLSHLGIVRVHSAVEQEGLRFFYVMEFVHGTALDKLLLHRPTDELLGYVLQIGEALAHIHTLGLLHRDVKPSNIIITDNGQAKLIDFDLVTGDAFAPMTTHVLGTAFYTPPEAGNANAKTPAYDVYGLARTTLTVLCGREAHLEEVLKHNNRWSLPNGVRMALRAALEPHPARRTSSIEAYCAAIRRWLYEPVTQASSDKGAVGAREVPGTVPRAENHVVDVPHSRGSIYSAMKEYLRMFTAAQKVVMLSIAMVAVASLAKFTSLWRGETSALESEIGIKSSEDMPRLDEPSPAPTVPTTAIKGDASPKPTASSPESPAPEPQNGADRLQLSRDPAQLLEYARKANLAGDGMQSYDLAKRSYELDHNSNALALMGAAACKMGDRAKARAAFNKMTDPNRRRQMVTVCAERDIFLE